MAESSISSQYSLPPHSSTGSTTTSPTPPPFSVTAAGSPDPNTISSTFSALHDNNSIRLQQFDNEQQEIKQTAVNALHQNSILAMHVIASGEVNYLEFSVIVLQLKRSLPF